MVIGVDKKKEKLDVFSMRFALLAKFLKEKYKVKYSDQIKFLKANEWGLDRTNLSHLIAKIPEKCVL